ncbi:asparaginase [Actinotalea sp. BY-33]|uniref:Asparaginase n=1 Tax=Actinotalea soli TaxID=2819234 RepID=A0A939LRS0_9CELL|nr:asparaginase [Actinotalea soli]MBO1753361.1 asparaginase [Actinotalea soli]
MVTGLLAEVVRGGLVESEHHGHLVLVPGRPEGASSELTVGDPDATIWPRSTVKPLQAVAMLRAGLEIDDRGLALACASHDGSAEHLAVVRAVLEGAGLGVDALLNTPTLPSDPEAAALWRAEGGTASSVTQNCSGKHAAMVRTCAQLGWDTATYLDPEHPLQQAIRATLTELTGVPVELTTVDGCGAPLLSTTSRGLARAFGRIASAAAGAGDELPLDAPETPEARVARVMVRHPELVGGPGREVTRLMRAVPGLVVKDGADGVYAAGLPDGTGLALKVRDGSMRPCAVVVAGALERALDGARTRESVLARGDGARMQEVLTALREVGRTPVLGHGVPVGEVRAVLDAGAARGGAS